MADKVVERARDRKSQNGSESEQKFTTLQVQRQIVVR